ncbi:MAG: hypothetical protein AAGA31_09950, partial [Bacteroidota bacterium]
LEESDFPLSHQEVVEDLLGQMVTALGGTPTTSTVKVVSAATVYDTAGSQTLIQVVLSDGAIKYYTDASAATEVADAGIVLGPFPSGSAASIDTGAGAVDTNTTRVTLATEDRTIAGKTGTGEWVKDVDTDTLIWQEAVYDAVAESFTYTYLDAPGGAPFVVGSTVTPASVSTGETITVAKVDDVAGDQSGDLINYVEVRLIDPETGATTLVATKTEDLSADYTVQGTPRNGSEIGVNARTAPFQETLPVGTWMPSLLVDSFAYAVYTVADTLNPPTFTDSDGNTDSLFEGESANFSLSDNTEALNTTNIQITVNSGDVVKVYGTKYSA